MKKQPPKVLYKKRQIQVSGPILESKGMCVIFQKKDKKTAKKIKKGKIFENLGKNVQNLKVF